MLKSENNYSAYMSTVKVPSHPAKPCKNSYPDTVAGAEAYLEAMKCYEHRMADYTEAMMKYNSEAFSKEVEFRRDLEAYYGSDKLPENLRSALYSNAYEHGHHAGFSEVASYYSDLCPIIDAVKDLLTNLKA